MLMWRSSSILSPSVTSFGIMRFGYERRLFVLYAPRWLCSCTRASRHLQWRSSSCEQTCGRPKLLCGKVPLFHLSGVSIPSRRSQHVLPPPSDFQSEMFPDVQKKENGCLQSIRIRLSIFCTTLIQIMLMWRSSSILSPSVTSFGIMRFGYERRLFVLYAPRWLCSCTRASRHLQWRSSSCEQTCGRPKLLCGKVPLFHLSGVSIPSRRSQHVLPPPSDFQSEMFPDVQKKPLSDWYIVKRLLGYIWPSDRPEIRLRVVVALTLLFSAKLVNVMVPFVFKYAVDCFSGNTPVMLSDVHPATAATTILLCYGLFRATASGLNELRTAVFARAAQSSIRQVGVEVFRHMHDLDLSYHLGRRTGALGKAIDRGARGIQFILTALVFNLLPTGLEVGMVTSILYYKYGLPASLIALACIGTYTSFTFAITRWRTQFRVDMNRADGRAGSHATDSLINYETVKYFNNENHEAGIYDRLQAEYERASIKTTTSLAVLNFGQAAIFSAGLAAAMVVVASHVLWYLSGYGLAARWVRHPVAAVERRGRPSGGANEEMDQAKAKLTVGELY
ncbi:hypothetical protein AHF37_06800 [Paragonimus kellicotti]|nr:hypothetical protein AHF37_06800 [Paragonimus kellicotti]